MLEPGSLIRTLPLLTSTLTFWPVTGGGSGGSGVAVGVGEGDGAGVGVGVS